MKPLMLLIKASAALSNAMCRKREIQRGTAGIAVLTLVYSTGVAAEPSATPYRPSVASGSTVSAAGYFELESGFQNAKNKDGSAQFNVPWLLKYGINDHLGVSVGGDAFLSVDDGAGNKINGVGDGLISARLLHPLNADHILGFETTVKIPMAKEPPGSGRTDYLINGIYGVDMGDYHADLNLSYIRLGVDDGDGQNRNGWAAAVSRAWGENGGLTLEFSGVHYRAAPDTSQFLIAYAYKISRQLVVDVGAAQGLNNNPLKQSVFTGFTYLFDH